MDIVVSALAIALVMKGVDFAKYLRAQDWHAVTHQSAAWVLGVGVIFLFAASDLAQHWQVFDGLTLAEVNTATQVIFGLGLASGGSVIHSHQKSNDNTQTAATPSLLTGARALGGGSPATR